MFTSSCSGELCVPTSRMKSLLLVLVTLAYLLVRRDVMSLIRVFDGVPSNDLRSALYLTVAVREVTDLSK